MAETENKRRRRDILNRRLDSYYEVLMLEARRGSAERWNRLVESAPDRRLGAPPDSHSTAADKRMA